SRLSSTFLVNSLGAAMSAVSSIRPSGRVCGSQTRWCAGRDSLSIPSSTLDQTSARLTCASAKVTCHGFCPFGADLFGLEETRGDGAEERFWWNGSIVGLRVAAVVADSPLSSS